jgi:hypothetical protein
LIVGVKSVYVATLYYDCFELIVSTTMRITPMYHGFRTIQLTRYAKEQLYSPSVCSGENGRSKVKKVKKVEKLILTRSLMERDQDNTLRPNSVQPQISAHDPRIPEVIYHITANTRHRLCLRIERSEGGEKYMNSSLHMCMRGQ